MGEQLTTICINELLINELQDLIDEVRSHLRDKISSIGTSGRRVIC